jgi:hypothetical protein
MYVCVCVCVYIYIYIYIYIQNYFRIEKGDWRRISRSKINTCDLTPCNFLAFPSLFQSVRSVIIVATSKDNHNSSFFVIALLVFRLVAIIQHPKVFFVSSGSLYAPKILLVQHPPTPDTKLSAFPECFCSVLYHKSAFRNQVSQGPNGNTSEFTSLRFTEVHCQCV